MYIGGSRGGQPILYRQSEGVALDRVGYMFLCLLLWFHTEWVLGMSDCNCIM